MIIQLNGETKEFQSSLTIQELLQSLQMGKKTVVVEVNKQAVFPRNYESYVLQSEDKVEIITISAGG